MKGVMPAMTAESQPFWDAAARGELLIERCADCGHNVFPARGVCARCRSRDMREVVVNSSGRVYSFTVNHNPWFPGMEVPFVLVLVEFPDFPGIRVVGRLRTNDIDAVGIGSAVRVGFEPGPGDLSIPSFTPDRAA
jgi:uncharacterized OB-fold protein